MRRHPYVARFVLVLASTAAAVALTLALPLAHESPVFAFSIAAVAISTWWGGSYSGAAALLLTVAEIAYFIAPPVGSFHVERADDLVRLVNFTGLGFLTVIVLWRLRHNQDRTQKALESERAARATEEQTRQELQDSERRFRDTFNQAAVGLAHVGLDGRWVRVNQKLCDIVGYTREELVSRTFQDLTHPDDLNADLELYRRLQAGDINDYSIEKRYAHKDGHFVWVNLNVALARDERGSVKYAIAAIEDITQRRASEQAKQQSDLRLRNAYRANGMWSWELDPTTNTITRSSASGESEAVFEGKREEAMAAWLERVHEDDRNMVRSRLAAVLTRTTDDYDVEFRARSSDGSYRWVAARATLIERPEGVVLSGIASDVTARHDQEAKLRYLGAIVESSDAAIIGKDLKGTITSWNRGAERLYGYRAEEVIGRPISLLIPDGRPDRELPQLLERLTWGEQIEDYESVRRHKDGHLIEVSLKLSPIQDERGGCIIGASSIARDITKLKQAERELRESESRFRRMYESNLMGVVRGDAAGRIIEANDAYLNLIGATREQLQNGEVRWDIITPPDALEADRKALAQAAERGYADPYEKRCVLKDGREVQILVGLLRADKPGEVLAFVIDNSERKRAEEALRESESRFRSLYENAAVGIEQLALDGSLLTVNEALCRMLGYSEEQLLARTFEDITHPEDRPREAVLLDELFTGQRNSYTIEKRYLRGDGSPVWVAVTSALVRDAEGKPSYRISVVQDIAERKRAEEQLRASEAKFRTLADNISQFAWMTDEHGWIFWYNRRWYEYTGTNLEDMQGWGWQKVHHPDHLQRVVDKFKHSIETGTPWEDTFPLRGRDGNYRWFLSRAMPIRNERDRIVRWFGTNTDITEQRAAEQALRTSEARFRELTENIPQLVWTVDMNGHTDFVSKRWVEYTGADIDATAGDLWLDFIHPDDRARASEAWATASRDGRDYCVEYRLRRIDGSYRWHFSHGIPIRDESGNVLRWFGTTTDMEDQKRAQQALIQSEKLASVGRMAATIAHEINNPLETVMNAVYLAWSDPAISPQARQQLDVAEQELERVAHITRQTLGFYRETGRAVDVVLSDIVNDILDIYQPRLRNKQIRVEREFATVRICAIPGEIKQIISNLIANGIDAMESGGTLHVRAGLMPGSNGHRMARLTIADTGCGIPREHARRIYEPFFTTKEAIGTGLGLWVSSELVKKHGGSIRMRSRDGRGTVFSLRFPAALDPCDARGAA